MSIMAKIMIIQIGKKLTDADHTNPLQLKTILILVKNNFDKDKRLIIKITKKMQHWQIFVPRLPPSTKPTVKDRWKNNRKHNCLCFKKFSKDMTHNLFFAPLGQRLFFSQTNNKQELCSSTSVPNLEVERSKSRFLLMKIVSTMMINGPVMIICFCCYLHLRVMIRLVKLIRKNTQYMVMMVLLMTHNEPK